MNDKIKNYIQYHDDKIKDAMIKRDKNRQNEFNHKLSDQQKQQLLTLLNYIKYNPQEALNNKNTLNNEIKKILSN